MVLILTTIDLAITAALDKGDNVLQERSRTFSSFESSYSDPHNQY